LFSPVCKSNFDYIIGSSHYLLKDGVYYSIDSDCDGFKKCLDLFDGDIIRLSHSYYKTFCQYIENRKPDVVGHFDLITKFEKKAPHLYATDSPEYKKMALDALYAVREKFELFEVNSGPIGRGYKSTPYPAPFILDAMRDAGCKLILTTDCHNKNFLDCGFDTSLELIKAHGFTEIYELRGGEFVGRKI